MIVRLAVVSMIIYPMFDRQQCAVLVVANDRIEMETEAGLTELERRGYAVFRTFGNSACDLGRNLMAYEALTRGFSALMWIDSDMYFQADDVDKLRCRDCPMICGLYIGRNAPVWTSQFLDDRPVVIGTSEVRPIKFAAGGFNLIQSRVYDAMTFKLKLPLCGAQFGQPLRPWHQPLVAKLDGRWAYFTEDYAFGMRARECGFEPMADLSVKWGHIGRAIHAPVSL